MAASSKLVPLAGSERAAVTGAEALGPVDATAPVEVTVRVRPRPGAARPSAEGLASAAGARPMTSEEYEATYGSAPADLDKVETFAHEHGLTVVDRSSARRSVVLAGSAAQMSQAFGVSLQRYRHAGGTYRGRTGPVQVPADLQPVIEAVLGLDDRPQATTHFRRQPPAGQAQAHAVGAGYSPAAIAKAYDFPAQSTGTGQCIAIIELGGGYRTADLKTYFQDLGLPLPKVSAVSVDGAHNQPTGNPNGPDGEVMLDIEVAGAVAPGARLAVYFAPNTDRGFLDAITTALHDPHRRPSVISISWGGPECNWTPQAMTTMAQALQAAALLGVTICVAAGDCGSTDGVPGAAANVDFPASSPYALACGGTCLQLSAQGAIAQETVWNDDPTTSATGGGISQFFPRPAWQAATVVPPSANPGHATGRGVPDVAGDADPASGYQVRVDGQDMVIGGTSAVAPLWAALIALLNQRSAQGGGQRVGYLTPRLYQGLGAKLRDVTQGNNGHYQARQGWDACTGWGSPDGGVLVQNLVTPTPAQVEA